MPFYDIFKKGYYESQIRHMQNLLTILIPTYNMQDYLHRCLDSLILNDEALMQQFEVVVINDGSKDNSSDIAHEYAVRYPQTFRVIDKKNGNYGSCINRGLKEAKGKYIKVLDADDWFLTSEFEKYLRKLNSIDADMVLTSFSIVNSYSNSSTLAYHPNLKEEELYGLTNLNLKQVGVYMMHAVTYRTELLRSIAYKQTEGISYTDTEWTYNPLYAVKTVVYLSFNVYQYLIGREGQTMDPKVMMKSVNHHEVIARSLIENESKHPTNGFTHQTIERQIKYLVDLVYRTRLVLQDEVNFDNFSMLDFDTYIKSYRPDLYRSTRKLIIKPLFPLPYVWYWRMFGTRFPVDKIRLAYRTIRYGYC